MLGIGLMELVIIVGIIIAISAMIAVPLLIVVLAGRRRRPDPLDESRPL